MKAATKSRDITPTGISPTYEFELKRLLFLVPAITEVVALEGDGVIRAQTSRFRAVSSDAGKDFSTSDGLSAIQTRKTLLRRSLLPRV